MGDRKAVSYISGDDVNNVLLRNHFYELALPILSGDVDHESYPPRKGSVRLVSKGGYEREIPVSRGRRGGDGFCSFRFDNVSTQRPDDLFTASVVWEQEGFDEKGHRIRTRREDFIFTDASILHYVKAAQEQSEVHAVFGHTAASHRRAHVHSDLAAKDPEYCEDDFDVLANGPEMIDVRTEYSE